MIGGKPTRSTVAGRVYLDLQNLARRQNRPTDELLQLYGLEGLLARLAASRHASAFVLKGGVLLAALGARRPTRDIDVQARHITIDTDETLATIREIATMSIDDGLIFHTETAIAQTIRDEDEYSGVRVTIAATLATAQLGLHVDVNVGDPIVPPPASIELPRLLGGTITLTGYPLVMVLAEKIVTAIQRGTVNTRWRDFADIYTLIHTHTVSGRELATAIADYRATDTGALSGPGRLRSHRTGTLSSLATQTASRPTLRAIQRRPDRRHPVYRPVLTAQLQTPPRWDPTSQTWPTA